MPPSGLVIWKAVTTGDGAGILPGTIAPMAGIQAGMIPGTIPLGMVAGTEAGTEAGMILGITAIMAGAIHTVTTVTTGLTPSIMVAAIHNILHAIVPHVSRSEQVVTALVHLAAIQQDADPSVAAMVVV